MSAEARLGRAKARLARWLGVLLLAAVGMLLLALLRPGTIQPEGASRWWLWLALGAAVLVGMWLARAGSDERCLHERLGKGVGPDAVVAAAMPAHRLPLDRAHPPLAVRTVRQEDWPPSRCLSLAVGIALLLAAVVVADRLQSAAGQLVPLLVAGGVIIYRTLQGTTGTYLGPVGEYDLGKLHGQYRGTLGWKLAGGSGVLQVCERGLGFSARLHLPGEIPLLELILRRAEEFAGCLPYYALSRYQRGGRLAGNTVTFEYIDPEGEIRLFAFTLKEHPDEALAALESTLKEYRRQAEGG